MTTPRAVGDAQSTALNATRHNNHKIGLVLALYNANVTTDWKTVALAASKIPIRAIVPVKGVSPPDPGWKPTYPRSDEVYRGGVKMLKDAGVEVYAYTHLRNLSKPCCECCGNLSQFSDWIKIIKSTANFDGVMLDNLDAPWSAADEKPSGLREMYAPAARMVREANLGVWQNGPHVSKNGSIEAKASIWKTYLGLSNFTTLFEMPLSDWINYESGVDFSRRLEWPRNKLGGYVLDIPNDPHESKDDIKRTLELAFERGLGWIYPNIACVHRTGSCTYATLPSYFNELVNAIKDINGM
eukprot:g2690.t1